ncbi:MAG: dTMP kinase [Bacteroidetes bacterium]|jgi:dTMP kinase|nr:dTMP kinase [Bacteroidota bacterium]
MPQPFDHPHPYPGRLIIVEGIDGSGKSTQLQLLQKWLLNQKYRVFFTEWNSSALVNETIKRGKKKNLLTPTTFSLLHATDFADRLAHLIIPPLKAGMIVCADRYVFTAFARDVVRGVHPAWVRNLYSFAVRPNLGLYFKVPIEVSLKRILNGRIALKFHEAGMDLGLSEDPKESYRLFQSQILEAYDGIASEYGLQVIEATQTIQKQQTLLRDMVKEMLKDYKPTPFLQKKENVYVA